MACFEPTIDYVVTKIPRFAFEKFPEADPPLTTQMKSVGETMAIGRTFKESFQKALRGLEVGSFGFGCDGKDLWGTPQQPTRDEIRAKLAVPSAERVWYLRYAMKSGMSLEEISRADRTSIRGFCDQLQQIVELEDELRAIERSDAGRATRCCAAPSSSAFPTGSLRTLWNTSEMEVRAERQAPRHRRHVQVGRYLRRGVRGLHAVLLLDLRRRGRRRRQSRPAASGS